MGNLLEYKNKNYKKKDEEKTTPSVSHQGNFGAYATSKVMENTIKLSTLQSDLTSLSKTIDSVYNGWQTRETMDNTLSSVQSMYDRLGKYQEYQKKYGGTDLSEIQSSFKSVIDGWEDISKHYGQYKDAESYTKETTRLGELGAMTSSDVEKARKDATKEFEKLGLEDKLKTAKQYEEKIKKLTNNVINIRNPSAVKSFSKTIRKATEERDNYLKSIGYDSIEAIENALSGKNIAYTTVGGKNITWQSLYDTKKYNEDSNALYKEISSTDDFEKYKAEGANIENPSWDEADRTISIMGFEPFEKDVQNVVEYAFDNKEMFRTANAYGIVGDDREYYTHMTSQERDIYNYHLGRERAGLAENGTAKQYLESIYDILKDRYESEDIISFSNYADKHPFLASGLSVLQNLGEGVEFVGDGINYLATGELDDNHLAKVSSAIRGTVSQKVDWEIGNWDAFDFVYNTGMSMADSAVAMTSLGIAGGAALGLSAAAQGTNDALERGLDNKSAFWNGLASGVFEAVFESFSIGKFKALKDAPVDGVKTIIKNVGKSMLTNASEETLTEIANILYDNIANADLSQAKTNMRAYMSQGMTAEEAASKAASEQVLRVGEAGASGALMGLGFGLFGGTVAYGKSNATGKTIKANERVGDLFDIVSNPEVASAYETYTRYANKGINSDNITDAQLGRLYSEARTDAVDTMNSKKATSEQKENASKTLSRLSVVKTENSVAKRAKELNVGEETKVTESGDSVKIEGIKTSGNDTVVVTQNGEVSLNDITLTRRDAELVSFAEQISKEEGEEIANLFVKQYDGQTNTEEYANAFNLAMKYVKDNFPQETILENKGVLSASQVNAIYQATVINESNMRETELKKLSEEQGKTMFVQGVFDDSIIDYNSGTNDGSKVNWNSLTTTQRSAIKFAKLFSKATGVNIKFIKSNVKDGKHKGENGSYNPNTNTISIDVYAGRIDATSVKDSIIPTLSHELTHWMKSKAPSVYNSIKEDVIKTLTESKRLASKDLIAQELDRLNKNHPDKEHTVDEAVDELVARACEDMLSNSNAARKLLNKMSATEQQSFIEKVKGTFENLIQWINDLLAHYKSTSEEAKILREYKHMLKKISKQWDEMLVKSIEANQALEKSGAYGVNNVSELDVRLSDKDYDYWLDKIETISDEDALKTRSEITYLRIADSTPSILQKYGAMNLPLIIRFDAMYLAQRGSGVFEGHYHHLGEDVMGNLLDYVSNPDAILKTVTTNKNDEEVVKLIALVSIPIKSGEALASIEINTVKDRGEGDELYNLVVTFFDYKENYLRNLFVKYGAETKYKKETLLQDNPKLHKWLGTIEKSVSEDSILNSDKNVKGKFSDRDSTGRELSDGQKEYFKDSVVRDEDGNLLVMYRGDSNEFTVFDRKKTNHANLYGIGFYFTKRKEHAEQYGASREFYLDIKNPLSPKQNVITKEQMLNFLKAIENDGEDYDLYNYGQDATAESVLDFVWGKGDFEMLQDINAGAIGDLVAAVELFNEVNGTSYDGIVLPTETVTFNSEQAKLTSNLNPTNDKDMRFSDRDYSYEKLVSKPDITLTEVRTVKKYSPTKEMRKWAVDEGIKNAKLVGEVGKNGNIEVFVNDTQTKITISRKSLIHGLDRRFSENLPATLKAGRILANSIKINELTPSIETAKGSYVLIGAAKNKNDEISIVRFVVNEFSNELQSMDVLYALNTKKESAVLNAPPLTNNSLRITDSTISIAELLDYVNKYFPDILPESVLRHYGYDARPDGKLGESALFSDREDTSVYDLMGEKDRLHKENERLKKDLDRLKERLSLEKKVTGGNYFEEKSLDAVAVHLRKIANSTYSKNTLLDELKDFYTYVRDNKWSGENLFGKAYELAEKILADAKPLVERNEYAKGILNEIRGKRISLTETQKKEARNVFGDKYLNAFFGKIIIANDGISLDSQWQEWASEYPGLFKADTNEGDQITALYDVYNALRDASEVIYEYDMEEQARWLANEILNKYWTISRIKTTADKYDMQINVLNFEHRKAMAEFRSEYEDRVEKQRLVDDMYYRRKMSEQKGKFNAELAAQRKAEQERHQKLVQEIRERKDKEIALAKQHGREMVNKYKNDAERKTHIQSITANSLTLNDLLVKNSKDKHIPEILRDPVIALIQAIDFSSKRLLDKGIPTRKDISLSKALGKVKDMMVKASNAHEKLVDLYGHGLDEDIEKMIESVDKIIDAVGDNEFILNNMTLKDLQTLDKMVRTIKYTVNKLNKFHTIHHARGVANLSLESVLYLNSLGEGKQLDGMRGVLKNHLNWNNALPYYVFKRFGSGGMKVYEAFQDGWDKFAFNIKKVIDYANNTYTSDEVKAWSEEVKTFKVLIPTSELNIATKDYTPKYQKVQLTIPQIMSMYCLNKREQARKHLFAGGIRVADFKNKKGDVVSQSKGVIFTENDVATILNSLTKRQKAVADKLQDFMNTVCASWGNEVSMARFGYKAFGENDYFPIQSDKNNLAVNDATEINSLFKLLNMSFTKSTDDNANNRIVISDIFDVFAQHASDMAKYNALALPVLDSFKWYNYTEKQEMGKGTFRTRGVKESIEYAFGKDGQHYFTTFLEDINGQQEMDREQLSKSFMRKYKIAAVGANFRVILLQPTSYARASAVIDNKYLTKALGHKPKRDKAKKYCGIALWKSMGYFDTNIQKGVAEQIKHDDTWRDKAVELSMKGAGFADEVTWGYLWNACELEIRDKRKDLKVGSQEFYDTIGKRLREVIYATQVVDSTMTRSQMMRSTKMHDQILTNFASEPTLAYNMLQDAYMEYALDARIMEDKKKAIKKHGKKIARIAYAYTITNVLAALAESAFDAFRDDDDEEMDMVAFVKLYLRNFASDMSITGKIPYIKEVHSLIQGYSLSRTELEWMETSYNAINGVYKNMQGKGKPVTTIKNSIKTLSYLSGLPFYSVYRDTMATLYKLDLFTEEDLNELFKDFFLYGIFD